ncbi:hypothetical protein HDU67_009471 [Dinochytrium kinnereticum]|nr:hypothetical protein HDU67_009471 [Dinochytrium kinnereticum]
MDLELLRLPLELLSNIATYLHPHEVVRLRRVCRQLLDNTFSDFEFAKRNLKTQRRTKMSFYRKLRFDKLGVNYMAAFIFLEGFCHENGSLQTMVPEFRLFTSSRLRPFPLPNQHILADALMKAVKAKRRIPNICESCAISWLASTPFIQNLRDLLQQWRDDKLDLNSLQLGFQQSLKYGTVDMAQLFIEEEATLHPVESMQVAVEWGHPDVVQLIMSTWNMDKVSLPYNCLITAASNGHSDVVKLLLENGKLDAGGSMDTPIREAAKNGHKVVVVMLLNAMEKQGRNLTRDATVRPDLPLHLLNAAAENGHTDIVQLLLPKFAYSHKEIRTAFRRALGRGHVEVSAFLLSRINVITRLFLKSHRLGYFASVGRLDVVHFVLDHRLVNRKEMIRAIKRAAVAGRVEMVKVLLQKGKICPSIEDNTLLLSASKHGHCDLVRMLLDCPTIRLAGNFNSAFVNAAGCGQINVMSIFLEKRLADINECGEEAILRAIRFGCSFQVIKKILDAITVDRQKVIKSALECACFLPSLEIAEKLLELDEAADLDNPLLESAKNGQTSTVTLILMKEAATALAIDVLWRAYTQASCNNHSITARIIWDFIKAREADGDDITTSRGDDDRTTGRDRITEKGCKSSRQTSLLNITTAWVRSNHLSFFWKRSQD